MLDSPASVVIVFCLGLLSGVTLVTGYIAYLMARLSRSAQRHLDK